MDDTLLGAGIAALRRFYRPFLLIQAAAVVLVIAYRLSPGVRAVCATVSAVKAAGGLPFAAASAAFAGGLLPELAKMATGGGVRAVRGRGGEVLFNTGFFVVEGLVIDLLYRLEARLFGVDVHLRTVLAKTAFDEGLFTPTWAVVIAALFLWRERGFSGAAVAADIRGGVLRRRVLSLLLPTWCFWVPMVLVIYAFPVPLQFLLFVLALAAWSLVMVVIAGGTAVRG